AKPVFVATAKKASQSSLPDSLRASIETWRRDWESRNGDAYLSHYHPAFRTDKHNYKSWSKYKRRVNSRKKYINVNISNLRLIKGPEQITEGKAVLVAFNQKYQSSNYAANSKKQLYMVRGNNNKWLILHEGDASQSFIRARTAKATQVKVNNKFTAKTGSWAINLGSFDSQSNAEQMASNIKLAGAQ
ncbi:MAG: SPOR domain-containing protein, partial [Mariprofundus sp.]